MAGVEDQAALELTRPVVAGGTHPALGEEFFDRPSVQVAPELLGCLVEHRTEQGVVVVRLTEVEAYAGPGDPGSHARNGMTPRTAVMFGPSAHLYVYFSYGMHWCVNLVCSREGTASAVLLRGAEVVDGFELARARRPAAHRDRDLARGPARLASALGLERAADGAALRAVDDGSPGVRVLGGDRAAAETIRSGPRVGVSGAGGDGDRYPWRFWIAGDPTVSSYRPGVPPRKRVRPAAS